MDDKDFLEHFGVRGMRWGRRKQKKEDTSSDDHKKKVALKKKKLHEMSNAELKMLNERLQLEKQYKSLTNEEISPGKKFVEDIFKNAAKQTITTYASRYMTKGVENLINIAVKG